MACPICGKILRIIDSRPIGERVRRRRRCPQNHRFTTYEEIKIKTLLPRWIKFAREFNGLTGKRKQLL